QAARGTNGFTTTASPRTADRVNLPLAKPQSSNDSQGHSPTAFESLLSVQLSVIIAPIGRDGSLRAYVQVYNHWRHGCRTICHPPLPHFRLTWAVIIFFQPYSKRS